jgi:hypothetical protein
MTRHRVCYSTTPSIEEPVAYQNNHHARQNGGVIVIEVRQS